jgi:hypothetical protein
MMGPGTPYRSPDGSWRWDGARWLDDAGRPSEPEPAPAPARRPGGRLRRTRLGAAALIALVLIGLLVLLAIGPLDVPARLGFTHPSSAAADRGVGLLAATMQGRGLRCGESPLPAAAPPRAWTCIREIQPWFEYVVVQADDPGSIDDASAEVGGLDYGTQPPSRVQALDLFQALLPAVFPNPMTEGAARAWVRDAMAGKAPLARDIGGRSLSLTAGDNTPIHLDVRNPDVDEEPLTWDPLPRVTTDRARGYMTGKGLSCHRGRGYDSCEAHSSTVDAYAGVFLSMAHPGRLIGLHVTIEASDGTTRGDVSPQVSDIVGGSLKLLFTGADQSAATTWLGHQMDGRAHRTILRGVQLSVRPARPLSWTGPGMSGIELQLDPAGWPT